MPYLAMTAAELHSCETLPEKIAWMACHFSPYGTGLTNLPTQLPENSLLILNDRTPIHSHDPNRIFDQLEQTLQKQKCSGLLLDFQWHCPQAVPIIKRLQALPCPLAVSEIYAKDVDCPVFLPPVPILTPVSEYLSPWKGREIWLEAALDGTKFTVTKDGSSQVPLHPADRPACPLEDGALHCHYSIEATRTKAEFTLRRTTADLNMLLAEAEKMGVTQTVGLYQELA